jgi:hypothetical protein
MSSGRDKIAGRTMACAQNYLHQTLDLLGESSSPLSALKASALPVWRLPFFGA